MSSTPATETFPELRFRLPGQWWQIPLHDRDEARNSIKALVSRQVGKADVDAVARDRMRRQLMDAVETAIEGDGQSMQVALEVVEEFPLPVSFTVFLPNIRLTPSVGVAGDAVISLLQKGLESQAESPLENLHRFKANESDVLRVHRNQLIVDEEASDELPSLVVDYWVNIPGTKRVVLVNFSTALTGIDGIMLTFFDSIIRASYWHSPAAE